METSTFRIYGVWPSLDKITGEECGGDDSLLKEIKRQSPPLNLCKKESMKKKWHEVTLYQLDDNEDIVQHWYFKKGVLTQKMF